MRMSRTGHWGCGNFFLSLPRKNVGGPVLTIRGRSGDLGLSLPSRLTGRVDRDRLQMAMDLGFRLPGARSLRLVCKEPGPESRCLEHDSGWAAGHPQVPLFTYAFTQQSIHSWSVQALASTNHGPVSFYATQWHPPSCLSSQYPLDNRPKRSPALPTSPVMRGFSPHKP